MSTCPTALPNADTQGWWWLGHGGLQTLGGVASLLMNNQLLFVGSKDTLQSQVACGNSTSKPTMVEVEYPLSYFGTNSSPCCQAQQNGRGKGSVLLHLWMVCLINSRAKNFDGLGKFMPSLCVLWMFCS